MAKRKLKQNNKSSDDETESQRPAKQFKKRNNTSTEIRNKNVPSTSKDDDSSGDSDICNLDETSNAAANDTKYESFTSFMKSLAFFNDDDTDDEHQEFNGASRLTLNDSKKGKHQEEESCLSTSLPENAFKEELDDENIKTLSIPSKLIEVVFLKHPASVTLHGYVEVSVWHGSINILGYDVKKNESIKVFSTEGTGLKEVVTLRPKDKLDSKLLKNMLERKTAFEKIDLEKFADIELSSIVLVVKKILLPVPLRFLELYYPTAVQTKWHREKKSSQKNDFKLSSTEQPYVIDLSGDFKVLSKQINKVIRQPVSDDAAFGPRILIRGAKNMGKSTLIRYLMNSSLNHVKEVYFLDTDPGQTEYTPPGVVSLFRVTKPLLGPSYAHQKKPLRMIFTGSINPGTSPKLYEAAVVCLVKYFNDKFPKETLFVNTMGWVQGVGKLCLQNIKLAVKPTIEIELVPPDPNLTMTPEVLENEVTVYKLPSKAPTNESGAPCYRPEEIRNFNLVAYLGQCQKPFLPISLINSFHPFCVSWDKIALYVMGKKVPAHRLVEAIHCSIVALCHVDLSFILKSDNPDFPMTLCDEPLCECLGFGLVRASDEANHLFYVVTPLTLDQLKNVNALVKGNIMIPNEIFLKQTIKNIPLPFTNHSISGVSLGLKSIPERAFHRTLTPNRQG